jgi:hypothetical protein
VTAGLPRHAILSSTGFVVREMKTMVRVGWLCIIVFKPMKAIVRLPLRLAGDVWQVRGLVPPTLEIMGRGKYENFSLSSAPIEVCVVAGESARPFIEAPWSQLASECQRFGHPQLPILWDLIGLAAGARHRRQGVRAGSADVGAV